MANKIFPQVSNFLILLNPTDKLLHNAVTSEHIQSLPQSLIQDKDYINLQLYYTWIDTDNGRVLQMLVRCPGQCYGMSSRNLFWITKITAFTTDVLLRFKLFASFLSFWCMSESHAIVWPSCVPHLYVHQLSTNSLRYAKQVTMKYGIWGVLWSMLTQFNFFVTMRGISPICRPPPHSTFLNFSTS